jgi:hypothetical protein
VVSGLAVDDGRDGVIRATGYEQQRRASVVAEVDSRRGAGVEVGERSLEQDPARARNSVAFVRRQRRLLG